MAKKDDKSIPEKEGAKKTEVPGPKDGSEPRQPEASQQEVTGSPSYRVVITGDQLSDTPPGTLGKLSITQEELEKMQAQGLPGQIVMTEEQLKEMQARGTDAKTAITGDPSENALPPETSAKADVTAEKTEETRSPELADEIVTTENVQKTTDQESEEQERSVFTGEEAHNTGAQESAGQPAPSAENIEEAERITIDNVELRSEEVQEILTRVPHWMIRWGNTLFFALILLVLAISWFVKYPDIIASETYVTTQIPPQKEYAKITAKISTIFVEDNQQVAKNTPLAILENTANHLDVFLLKSIIDTITLNSSNFSFPIDSLPVLFLGEIDADFALFETSYTQYVLNKELDPFTNEETANRYSRAELQNRLSSLLAQKDIIASEVNIEKTDLERHKSLHEKGVISTQEYEVKQRNYFQAEKGLKNINLTISQTREAISNANKTLRGTTINRTKEEANLFKSVVQSFSRLKKAVLDWELSYVLRSDIDGKVSFMNVWNVNQTVSSGDLVFTIVPAENSSYVAKLRAPSKNSGKIKKGQIVNIKLENYPDEEFGVLRGNIENISLIPDKEGFYLIDVVLPEKLVTTYDKEIEFKQEMQGAAEIVTEDLRLIERFFYELKDVFSR